MVDTQSRADDRQEVSGQRPPLKQPIQLRDNARTVLTRRYLRKGADGKPVETIEEMFWRVAWNVAAPETTYGSDQQKAAERFFDLLTSRRFLPNSPTFTGAGTPLGQLAACFVLAIEDDMGRAEAGIFQTLRDAALIQQTGGGNGFSFSRLRPKGARVNTSMGEASGPIGFLRVYDQAFDEIAQGGCLTPDTLVFTERGLLRLDEIVQQEAVGWRAHSLDVATDDGFRRSRQVFNNGVASVHRVVTDLGTQLTGTANHKVKVLSQEGPVWRRLDQLEAGDQILVRLGQHTGTQQNIRNGNRHFSYAFDAESAYQLGRAAGGASVEAHLFDMFVHAGLLDKNGAMTTLPAIVRQSPVNTVEAFLRGLYDAKSSDGKNAITDIAPSLGREIAILLLGIGLPARCMVTADNRACVELVETPALARVLADGMPAARMAATPFGAAHIAAQADDIILATVESVEPAGVAPTLDLEVDDNHTYIANGLVTHNSRRGANMGVLRVDHPDIREFITCKTDENAITNFNISVGVTDAFMEAVKSDSTYDLINPQDGSVWDTLRAREVFDLIVEHAHHNGEPGMLFLDAANRDNPVPHLYHIEATNPCGEQFLGPNENCCLGSINLAEHAKADGSVDWAKLQESVETATRFLDDVVDANAYVPGVPALKTAAMRVRRIGLGIMGLADLMYHNGVRYGSSAGQEFASQVMEFVHYHAMRTSVALAEERGAFLAITGSLYDPDDLKWQPPTPLIPHQTDWGRPTLDWNEIVTGIKTHGIRNGAQTTIAPTGTISTVAGCEGYGCEPVFALAYTRYFDDNGTRQQLQYTSPLFEQALIDAGLDQAMRERIVADVNRTGSCQAVEAVPELIRNQFVVSGDISAEEHVRMQAALQRFVSNAISKTCNFPAGATADDVATAYQLAWELGCKGLTVYVAGSRDKVVLETAATADARDESSSDDQLKSITSVKPSVNGKKAEPVPVPTVEAEPEQPAPTLPLFKDELKKPRSRVLKGYTYRVETPLGATFITINENGGDLPFEVFIHTAKAGSETAAVSEALGRLISYILRMNSPVDQRKRLKEIVRQLEGIGGGRSLGLGPNRVRSLPDGVAQVLDEYLMQDEPPDHHAHIEPEDNSVPRGQMPLPTPMGDLCPECGQAAVVREEGCRKCYACSYSEC